MKKLIFLISTLLIFSCSSGGNQENTSDNSSATNSDISQSSDHLLTCEGQDFVSEIGVFSDFSILDSENSDLQDTLNVLTGSGTTSLTTVADIDDYSNNPLNILIFGEHVSPLTDNQLNELKQVILDGKCILTDHINNSQLRCLREKLNNALGGGNTIFGFCSQVDETTNDFIDLGIICPGNLEGSQIKISLLHDPTKATIVSDYMSIADIDEPSTTCHEFINAWDTIEKNGMVNSNLNFLKVDDSDTISAFPCSDNPNLCLSEEMGTNTVTVATTSLEASIAYNVYADLSADSSPVVSITPSLQVTRGVQIYDSDGVKLCDTDESYCDAYLFTFDITLKTQNKAHTSANSIGTLTTNFSAMDVATSTTGTDFLTPPSLTGSTTAPGASPQNTGSTGIAYYGENHRYFEIANNVYNCAYGAYGAGSYFYETNLTFDHQTIGYKQSTMYEPSTQGDRTYTASSSDEDTSSFSVGVSATATNEVGKQFTGGVSASYTEGQSTSSSNNTVLDVLNLSGDISWQESNDDCDYESCRLKVTQTYTANKFVAGSDFTAIVDDIGYLFPQFVASPATLPSTIHVKDNTFTSYYLAILPRSKVEELAQPTTDDDGNTVSPTDTISVTVDHKYQFLYAARTSPCSLLDYGPQNDIWPVSGTYQITFPLLTAATAATDNIPGSSLEDFVNTNIRSDIATYLQAEGYDSTNPKSGCYYSEDSENNVTMNDLNITDSLSLSGGVSHPISDSDTSFTSASVIGSESECRIICAASTDCFIARWGYDSSSDDTTERCTLFSSDCNGLDLKFNNIDCSEDTYNYYYSEYNSADNTTLDILPFYVEEDSVTVETSDGSQTITIGDSVAEANYCTSTIQQD